MNHFMLEKEKEIEAARRKTRQTLDGAKATAEYVFDEIDKLRKARAAELSAEELAKKKREIREAMRRGEEVAGALSDDAPDDYVLPRPLKKGDDVKMRNIGKRGVLLEDPDKNGNVRIQCGPVVTRTHIDNLRLLEKEEQKEKKEAKSIHHVSAVGSFSPVRMTPF